MLNNKIADYLSRLFIPRGSIVCAAFLKESRFSIGINDCVNSNCCKEKCSETAVWITTGGTDYREVVFLKAVFKPTFGFPGKLHNLHGESCK